MTEFQRTEDFASWCGRRVTRGLREVVTVEKIFLYFHFRFHIDGKNSFLKIFSTLKVP